MRFALAVLLLLVAVPARAQVDPKAKTMTTRELWEWAAKKSDIVLLGRVLAPVSEPMNDTTYAAYLGVQCVIARVEPIEWLKGKLDGEEIEVRHNWAVDRSDQRLRAIAGRDTTAAILFLKRRGSNWYLLKLKPPLPPEGPPSNSPSLEWALQGGFVPVSQRHFKSLTDQLHGWFEKANVAAGEP
jgi:hypothetical protein